MWYVYILLCKDRSLYTGISTDPKKRFTLHQNGKGGKYTLSHKPVKIVFLEKVKSKSKALKREMEIKGWSRQEKIRTLKLKF